MAWGPGSGWIGRQVLEQSTVLGGVWPLLFVHACDSMCPPDASSLVHSD